MIQAAEPSVSNVFHYMRELLIGNFSPNNVARDYMEVIGEWFLHHRMAEQLLDLAQQAGLEYRHIQVDREPEGVNLFLRVRR